MYLFQMMFVCQLLTQVPLIRENRLYPIGLRFYGFKANEILEKQSISRFRSRPKMGWALRNITQFPVIIQHAPLEMICAFQELVSNQHIKLCMHAVFKIYRWNTKKIEFR
jgi:predicted DNA-binding helix-hairpin-helix protein